MIVTGMLVHLVLFFNLMLLIKIPYSAFYTNAGERMLLIHSVLNYVKQINTKQIIRRTYVLIKDKILSEDSIMREKGFEPS